jgi:uncharacterized protein
VAGTADLPVAGGTADAAFGLMLFLATYLGSSADAGFSLFAIPVSLPRCGNFCRRASLRERMSDSRHRDHALAVGALTLLGAASALGPSAPRSVTAAIVATGLVIAAMAMLLGGAAAKPTAVLAALLMFLVPTGLLWQPLMALALGMLALAGWRWPDLRTKFVLGTVPWAATLAAGAVTPVALVGWVTLMRPDLHDVTQRYVPNLPIALLAIGGLIFVVANAALEELIWRGVFQDGLERLMAPGAAIAIQAMSFGILHAHGVPRGFVGVVLAGVWAAMLGMLRRRSGGLLAPFLAHAVADTTIAVIIFTLYR